MDRSADRSADRCAAHPARAAVDACPVCARPRCGPDADTAPGGGCAACLGQRSTAGPRPLPVRETAVRAALAGYAAAVAMGFVVSEYVGAGLFAYVTPFLLGVLTGEAVQRAAAAPRPGPALRGLAAALSVAGAAVGHLLEGSAGLASAPVLLAYAAAAAGALLWTTPPARRPAATAGPGA